MLVARGARLASFFWIQSWCATMKQRALLYEQDFHHSETRRRRKRTT